MILRCALHQGLGHGHLIIPSVKVTLSPTATPSTLVTGSFQVLNPAATTWLKTMLCLQNRLAAWKLSVGSSLWITELLKCNSELLSRAQAGQVRFMPRTALSVWCLRMFWSLHHCWLQHCSWSNFLLLFRPPPIWSGACKSQWLGVHWLQWTLAQTHRSLDFRCLWSAGACRLANVKKGHLLLAGISRRESPCHVCYLLI